MSGSVNGGTGGGTLDDSAYSTSVSVNLGTNKATGVTGLATNLVAARGGSAVNTLTGPNTVNNWHVTGINAGDLNGTFTFTAFANLTGGTNTDNFVFSDQKGVTGTVDGGAGTNRLDFSAYLSGVYVNLNTKLANAGPLSGMVVKNILQVYGSGVGGDVLVGFGTGVMLQEAAGNNLMIGGSGAATLRSGTGFDLVIDGSTSYDMNAVALLAIESFWASVHIVTGRSRRNWTASV